jgi:hypothetical protein
MQPLRGIIRNALSVLPARSWAAAGRDLHPRDRAACGRVANGDSDLLGDNDETDDRAPPLASRRPTSGCDQVNTTRRIKGFATIAFCATTERQSRKTPSLHGHFGISEQSALSCSTKLKCGAITMTCNYPEMPDSSSIKSQAPGRAKTFPDKNLPLSANKKPGAEAGLKSSHTSVYSQDGLHQIAVDDRKKARCKPC